MNKTFNSGMFLKGVNNKKLWISIIIVTAMFSSIAYAGETSLTLKYEQTFKESKVYKPKVNLYHQFDNNIKLGIEHNRKWKEDEKTSGFPEFDETLLSLSYRYVVPQYERLTLWPGLDYKFNSGKETARPFVKLYYSSPDGWGIGARYRYEYRTYQEEVDYRTHVNRFDMYLDYAISDKVKAGWNPNYAYILGSGPDTLYTGDDDRVEHEFYVSYKIDSMNSVSVTYKRKDRTSEKSNYNKGDHNDAVQLAYSYKF